ncbi:MAG: hypothetical protein LBN08_00620 [Lactobacillales bacterium]|jgi:hypothetical protein|nr:hypothetical protein [Lactobacillales bacterium]
MRSGKMKIADLKLTQIYISVAKLKAVESWLGEGDAYDPICIRKFGSEWLVLDGHARLLALANQGALEVEVEVDRDELSPELARLYLTCREWADELSIKDLNERILNDDDYQKLWIERCRAELAGAN